MRYFAIRKISVAVRLPNILRVHFQMVNFQFLKLILDNSF